MEAIDKWDYFFGCALQGLLASGAVKAETPRLVEQAADVADLMLHASRQRHLAATGPPESATGVEPQS